jgi:ParB family chromosome partitioning protein
LVPVQALRDAGGEIRVRYGHRCILAAIEAGRETVPVLVSDAEDDQAARIIAQLTDNHDRALLPARDEISSIGQLFMFGMSAAQIARRTNSARKDVDSAIFAASSKLAVEAAQRYEFLTLDQAAAVAEIADDRLAVSALIVTAQRNPEQFDEVLKRQRERPARLDRARANRHQVDRITIVPTSADYAPDIQTAAYVEKYYDNQPDAVGGRSGGNQPLSGETNRDAKQPSGATKMTGPSVEPKPVCCDHDPTAEGRQAEDVFAGQVAAQGVMGDQPVVLEAIDEEQLQ